MRCSSYFYVLLSFFVMNFSSVISSYTWYICNNDSTYTDGSTYSVNLDQVMTDLFRNTPQSSGFNTSSFGQTPNKIYGLLQCIGNVSEEKCSECAQAANDSLHEIYTNTRGALILMDGCFLRYDNSNFISTLNTNLFYYLPNVNNISGNMDDFKATTFSLLSRLSNEAYDHANKRFAIGSANYSPSYNVYGLVQCWRDLSISDCRKCLFTARNILDGCCSVREGARAMSPSCTVRFEIYNFFDATQSSSPEASQPPPTTTTSPSPEASPRPPTTTTSPSPEGSPLGTQSKKKSLERMPIILGVVGGLLMVLVICLIATRKRVRFASFGRPVTIVTHNEVFIHLQRGMNILPNRGYSYISSNISS